MKRLITLGIGAALGYLLGSREGRRNLDRFAQNAQSFWNDPKTQEQVQRATNTVKEQAPVVADKAAGLAGRATDAVKDVRSGGKHADSPAAADSADSDVDNTASGTDTVTTPSGDVVSDPSASLEAEGGGPARP